MGNDIGAPEVPYMSYGPKRREKEEDYGPTPEEIEEKKRKSKARNLSDESLELYREGRYEEALIFANRSLEYDSKSSAVWNRKGIIMDGLNRFEESVECYDAAIDLKDNEIYENNKAETCIAYASSLKDSGKYPQALDIINNSITIFKEISYKTCESEAYNLKGLILEKLDRIPEAFESFKKTVEYAGKDDGNIETYRKNRDRLIQYIKSDETRCPRCGREIKITDNFCTRCGMKFDMIIEGNEFGDTEYSGDVSVIEIHEK